MKKTLILGIVMLLAAVAGLQAQDTIDTNYYRYDNHFIYNDLWNTDPLINGYIHVCPNGLGFYSYMSWRFDSRYYNTLEDNITGNPNNTMPLFARHYGYLTPTEINCVDCENYNHIYYKLGAKKQKIYGIAFAIDSIFNLTEGDSMTAILCTRSEDHTRFIDLDSITLKGGEMGKRRWIELPMLKSEVYENEFDETSQPFENCIDGVRYLQVLEFYFDGRSYTIDDDYLFWKLKVSDTNGSVFCGTSVGHPLAYVSYVTIRDGEIDRFVGPCRWDFLFPIVEPLPEWEEPTITQVVPDAHKPNTPDPRDPDDPQNPNDPDDPDNPGGDEGIDNFEIQNSEFEINIYPNPASGVTTVSSEEPIIDMVVRDMAGRTVMHQTACGTTASFDTTTLRKGVYLVKVTATRGTATKKLVVEP